MGLKLKVKSWKVNVQIWSLVIDNPTCNFKTLQPYNLKTRYRFPGDVTGGGPPVPIPNTVVKPTRDDDTEALGFGKIGHRQDYF